MVGVGDGDLFILVQGTHATIEVSTALKSPEIAILLLTLAFFAPLVLTYTINKHPNLVAKGQDAAGRGMAVGCTSILLMIVSGGLALTGAIIVGARHKDIAVTWSIVGVLPVVGSLIAAFVVYTAAVVAKNRRIEQAYQEAMSIPAALIVDDDDARFSRLYDAIKPSFPTLEISMRHPGALYWQQREWFPRLRLLMISAEAMLVTDGQTGELTRDLLDAMCCTKPACPIVLHATTSAAAETIGTRLAQAGWVIHNVVTDGGDDWIAARWKDVAVSTLQQELEKRPEKAASATT